ncbi:hypothetical protein [Nitriliruptor alkaliphilus]|uniref:hypothetical protein n=1 Tax=Nitriliruptor alkaliphilus TaxID=427918 RepID=UPI000696C4F6|nr:hypothetical protein [Nitriliruptor alkaliphilus]
MTGAVHVELFETRLQQRPDDPIPNVSVTDPRAIVVSSVVGGLGERLTRERALAPVLEAVATGQPGVTQLAENLVAVIIPGSDVLVVYETFIDERRTDIPLTPFLELMDRWVDYLRRPSPRGTQTHLLPWPWEGRFRPDRLPVMLCGYVGPEDRAPALLGAPLMLERFVAATYPDLADITDQLERSLDLVIDGTWSVRRTAPDRVQIREHTDDHESDNTLTILLDTLHQLDDAIAGPYPFDGDAAAELPWIPDQW